MSRQNARETALKLVYEYVITNEKNTLTFNNLCEGFDSDDKIYVEKVYEGVIDRIDFLSDMVKRLSVNFAFDRIYKVDLACIYLGIFEIYFMDDIPDKVSANEATNLAKTYSSEKSYSFVNGILASVIKEKNEGSVGI